MAIDTTMPRLARPSGTGTPWLLLTPVLIFIAGAFLIPLGYMVWLSVSDPVPSFGNYYTVLSQPFYSAVLWRTFLISVTVALCCLLLAYPVALYAAKADNWLSRTILLAEATFSPHAAWMAQQVRNVLWECEDMGIRPRFLLHDRDRCFCNDFDAVLRSAGVEPLRTPYHAPNANAFAERWIRSAREECLNHLILFGLKSLQRVVRTYRDFHNEHRPHQGVANRVPRAVRADEPAPAPVRGPIGKVHCEESLGGLLKSYRRAA